MGCVSLLVNASKPERSVGGCIPSFQVGGAGSTPAARSIKYALWNQYLEDQDLTNYYKGILKYILGCKDKVAGSSSGPGYRPFKPEDQGSNPCPATIHGASGVTVALGTVTPPDLGSTPGLHPNDYCQWCGWGVSYRVVHRTPNPVVRVRHLPLLPPKSVITVDIYLWTILTVFSV